MNRAILPMIAGTCFSVASGLSGGEVLRGGGATFPHPLYQAWFEKYRQEQGDTKILYEAVGSGAGIQLLLDRQCDFGASDAFLSDEDLKKAPAPILHMPTCIGAVAIVYRLSDNPMLRFTPDLLTRVFMGEIKKWNDPRLSAVNPGVRLPNLDIALVHRSDSSGTTSIFTDYLTKVNDVWKKQVGQGKTVKWPSGMGVEGNAQLAKMIKEVDGSIGYVEMNYAAKEKLAVAQVRNRAGNYIVPGLEAVTLAGGVDLPDDLRQMITDTAAPQGYPISGFSYLIFYKEQAYDKRTPQQAMALARFLWWAVHAGQIHNSGLYYGALPKEAITKAEIVLRQMTFDGKKLLD